MKQVMVDDLHPLRFEPILKRLIWGGRKLGHVLGKPIGEGSDYAESWEISDHRLDVSRVAEGPLSGTLLRDIVRGRGEDLFGPGVGPREQFPLLIKFIDARQDLSVQVHPDDDLGLRLANDNGKTETWVVIDAEPGSKIYAGLKAGTTRDDMARAIESGTVESLLHSFPARPGDCILIPAGTVHAIGAGVVLAEVQQMSDATFRLHDWGRVGVDGNPRQLHLAEALESIDFEAGPVAPMTTTPEPIPGGHREQLARSAFFDLNRLILDGPTTIGDPSRFTIVICLGGSARVQSGEISVSLELGQTVLLPAAIGPCEVRPLGRATLLTCVVP
ncbi:type I phosphomannose isomerase catalytic subunit [Tundrisphaera lichenicola]|uniref:type I phosphomannose isomerase catalytic subunit n=1 Tax=Tundrisphaera lichenicola TaxID=2029860 RepID=UPI003EB7EA9E